MVEWLNDLAWAAEHVLYQRGLAPDQLLTHRTLNVGGKKSVSSLLMSDCTYRFTKCNISVIWQHVTTLFLFYFLVTKVQNIFLRLYFIHNISI